jgi:methylated-DNA-[protein]-cysteine S-methyltransferase
MRAWTYPRWRPAWQAAREIVRRERIEAIVCGKALFEGRAALRLQKEFGIPLIVCTYAMEIPVWLAGAKTRHDLREVLQDAARVLVINEQTKQVLRTFGVPEGKLVKLYPGVAEAFFVVPPDGGAFRSRFGLDGKRVIASVARLVPRKGLDVLIRAFAEVRRSATDAHLFIAGDGPERDHLALLVREAHQEDSVTLLGEVSSDDLRSILACAEFFALTPKDFRRETEDFLYYRNIFGFMGFSEKIWQLCKKVPKGKVTTYKLLAEAAGTKAYRAVGNALNKNPYGILNCGSDSNKMVPCHRVVGGNGDLVGFAHGLKKKAELLRKEGIRMKNWKIEDFEKVLHRF